MTPEEKKAQREAANAAKAAKKDAAAKKNLEKAEAEAAAPVKKPEEKKVKPRLQPSERGDGRKPESSQSFSKFDPGSGGQATKYHDISEYTGTSIHPKILELILNLQTNVLEHSNQICIATLFALREFLNDYQVGVDSIATA